MKSFILAALLCFAFAGSAPAQVVDVRVGRAFAPRIFAPRVVVGSTFATPFVQRQVFAPVYPAFSTFAAPVDPCGVQTFSTFPAYSPAFAPAFVPLRSFGTTIIVR